MPPVRSLAFATIFALAGCAAAPGPGPSLAPRTAEAIDPRVPVEGSGVQAPVDRALANRLAELIGLARQGDSAFA
nr:hypothetical protein [Sphingomonas sp.]